MLILADSRYRTRLIVLCCLQYLLTCTFASYEVFFNSFGDCQRSQPFGLTDETYTLQPVGGGFAHENLICDMTFKAPLEYGICLTFDELKITDCSVKIKIFSSSTSSPTSSADLWRTLDCNDSKPSQMCKFSRYVTVQVMKDKLNNNRGYKFKIHVEKSNTITQEGVLFASIGVFVGVILGVVVIIAILAISILYCCCKHRHGNKKKTSHAEVSPSPESRSLVQPSAPPPDIEDQHWILHPQGHLYPLYSPYQNGQPPPPYVPPPPYQPDEISQEQELTDVQRPACAVKPY